MCGVKPCVMRTLIRVDRRESGCVFLCVLHSEASSDVLDTSHRVFTHQSRSGFSSESGWVFRDDDVNEDAYASVRDLEHE